MNKVMKSVLTQIFGTRENIEDMFSKFPDIMQNVPNFMSMCEILTKLNMNCYATHQEFADDFRNNFQMLINYVDAQNRNDQEFNLISLACQEILNIFNKKYPYWIRDEEDIKRDKVMKLQKDIFKLKTTRPSNFEDDVMIQDDIVSFNPVPICTKVFPEWIYIINEYKNGQFSTLVYYNLV